jgi:hypothetical protein
MRERGGRVRLRGLATTAVRVLHVTEYAEAFELEPTP